MKKYFLFLCLLPQVGAWADEALPPPPDRSFLHTLAMMVLAGILFYLVLFRPEQSRRKKLEKQRSAMKKGDKVTAMGIVGTVTKIQENTVIVTMYDGSKLEFLKAAISDITPSDEEEVKASTQPR